jgi:hypothetical protein
MNSSMKYVLDVYDFRSFLEVFAFAITAHDFKQVPKHEFLEGGCLL